jgi:hypothetical protein
MNGICLLYADDVNMLPENINTMKKNPEAVSEAGMEVGVEANRHI